MSKTFLTVLFTALPSFAIFAQVTWDRGAGTADWQTPANWSSNTLPGAGDLVDIASDGPVVLGSGSGTAGALTISDAQQLTVSGGASLTGIGLRIGDGSNGSMIVTGPGTEVFYSSDRFSEIIVGLNGGTGVLTISDGALVRTAEGNGNFLLGYSGSSSGTLNLNTGGILATGDIRIYDGGQFNFNGGVFRLLASSTNVFYGFTPGEMELLAGSGTIDTNGFNATAVNVISGSGNLRKQGAGTLTLSGASTYTGSTTIDGGILSLSGSLASTEIAFTLTDSTAGQLFVENAAFSFGGTLSFDLSGVSTAASWTLFDGTHFGTGSLTSALTVSSDYGAFTSSGGEIYTLTGGGFDWTFDRDAGTLTATAIPEPGTLALAVLAGASIYLVRRRRIDAIANLASEKGPLPHSL